MPVTAWDEYPLHQTSLTVDVPATDDLDRMDRLWFTGYTADGATQFMAGFCAYPNREVADGFFLVRHGDEQRNVRVSRHLRPDRFAQAAGPLTFTVDEPLNRWSIELAGNDAGVGAALRFTSRSPVYLFGRPNPLDTPTTGFSHYRQFGHFEGTVSIDGTTIELSGAHAVRDRSWGVRDPRIVSRMNLVLLVEAAFEDCSLILNFRRQEGVVLRDSGEVEMITGITERITFDDETGICTGVDMVATMESGQTVQVRATPVSPPCYFTGGGYDGRHGLDLGPLHVEHESWDVGRPSKLDGVMPYYALVSEVSFGDQHGAGHVEIYIAEDENWTYHPTMD
ncbi:hypothetical protein [Amycolatopsis thermoflava]|uniref:hypothetical protein n=1 Tax=Amycolatopsis thermoflava TaxID=84480 RepID=UPI0038235E20